MKKSIYTIMLAFVLATVLSGCANRKVSRINSNEVVDLSGRWNDTDSQLVSAEMISDLLTARWLPIYESQHANKRPVVVVGTVTNKSHEHISSETFIKDIEKAIIKNGSVRLVQAGEKRQELRVEREQQNQGYTSAETAKKWGLELGADFMLQGTINSIVDAYKKNKVVYYQIDLELTNLETNEVVWMGDKKIKKQELSIGNSQLSIELKTTTDIAATLGASKQAHQRLIGFALETHDEHANAERKLQTKNLDMIVLNSLQDKGAGFGVDTNKVTLLYANGTKKDLPLLLKQEVADTIIDSI